MLNLKVIGCGAAGNKAAVNLIDKGFSANDVVLINSTGKDIPSSHKDISIIFGASSESLGGCGKEREVGKNLFLQDLKSDNINLDAIVDPDTRCVIVVSSTEGGSGSGITPIVAKYVRDVLNIPVIVCLFFGFNTDVRGMQNSIEICQELDENYGVIGIANSKFLDMANGNKLKAELLANEEFFHIVKILSGVDIKPGSQNIDDTDLYKLVVTPGYMCIGSADLKNIKNIDMFNRAVVGALDNSKLIDTKRSAKRIGTIFDIPEPMQDFVDYDVAVLTQRYGSPYESYTHVQSENSTGKVTWISAGMDLPIDEIKEIFENYKENSEKVSKSKDTFFGQIAGFTGNREDGMFNMLTGSRARTTSKSNFLDGYKSNRALSEEK